MQWAAFPFSRGSFQPKDWTQVSHIAGGFFTSWTIWEAPKYWSGQPIPSPGDLSNPGIEPRSPTLQVDSLPAEPYGKPKNTGVGSLSLLQGIFPTQELNQGLLHCRQILYQLSYQGTLSIDRRWLCITVNAGTVFSNTCGQINRLSAFTCLILWVLWVLRNKLSFNSSLQTGEEQKRHASHL